jgi:hypothetical protein
MACHVAVPVAPLQRRFSENTAVLALGKGLDIGAAWTSLHDRMTVPAVVGTTVFLHEDARLAYLYDVARDH